MSGFKLKFESHFDIHSKKKGNDQELTKKAQGSLHLQR